MLDKNDLQAIAQLVNQNLDVKLQPINEQLGKMQEDIGNLQEDIGKMQEDIGKMQEDIGILKEDSKVTRNSVNTLLDWAEDAQIEVKIPLYRKAQ